MPDAPQKPAFTITSSRQFNGWLASVGASLAITTYQTGKLFLIGLHADGRLSVFERTLERVMGMHATRDALHLSTLYQIWRFHNMLQPGDSFNGYDAVFVPRASYVTGDIDIHDLTVDQSGRPVFANTLFNCVATTHPVHSFAPLWRPSWISGLVPEDRCHLNGLAFKDGVLSHATAVSRSDVHDAWRDRRRASGVLVDTQTNEVVCEGLSMPHSPRWYRGDLWLLDSGTGFFGRVDLNRGVFEPLVFCPGFARGLAFIGDYAVIGLSDRRENRTFQDLPLEGNLAQRDAESRCGLQVVDLNALASPHWVRFEGVVRELYDVAIMPGIARPMAIGFKTDEIRRYLSFPQ